jgi:hypothetical protein
MFEKLLKAAIATALTPASLAADILCLPSDACDGEIAPRTRGLLSGAGQNVKDAVAPTKDKPHD